MQKLFEDQAAHLKEPEWTIAYRAKNASEEKIAELLGNWQFKRKPFAHQTRCTMIGCYTDCFIFNVGTGGGKTKTGVDIFNIKKNLKTSGNDKFKPAQRCLVICPATILNQWKEEFQINSDISDITVVEGSAAQKIKQFEQSTAPVVIVSHHWFRQYLSTAEKQGRGGAVKKLTDTFDTLLLDDIDTVGTVNSVGFKNYRKYLDKVANRYILSATLFNVKHENIWGLYYLMDRGATFGTNYNEFLAKYFHKYENDRYTKYYLRKNMAEDFMNRMWRYIIRYETKKCIDLPEQNWIKVDLSMTPEQTKKYQERLELGQAYEAAEGKRDPRLFTDLLRICDGMDCAQSPKFEHTCHLIDKCREENPQLVIWHHLREEADYLKENLAKKFPKLRVACYGGPTAKKARDSIKAAWERKEVDILIVNVSALSHGVNFLRAANTAIYFSNNYSLTTRLQTEGRLHRPGQEKKCFYYDLTMKEGIDQIMVNSLQRKRKHFKELVRDEDADILQEVAAQVYSGSGPGKKKPPPNAREY